MSEHYPRVRIRAANGHLLVQEGLSICFYMRHPHQQIADRVMASLERYIQAVGTQTLDCYADSEGEWNDLDEAGWAMTRRKLREEPWSYVTLMGGAEPLEYLFDYLGKPLDDPSMATTPNAVSALAFWLPSAFLEKHGPEYVRTLAVELAEPLPFCSGHAGLSFNGVLNMVGVAQAVGPYCLRHPGMDVSSLESLGWKIGPHVRGPHWLNFLGQPVLGELGGAAGLQARLHAPGTTVQPLEGDRLVVTLGTWPEAGDIERGEILPAYRELARVLEPYLFHDPNGVMLHFMPEETRRWERRFLD